MTEQTPTEEMWLQGRAVVPGVAVGSLFLLPERSLIFREKTSESNVSVEQEIRRFSLAIAESQAELRSLFEKLQNGGFCQEADIVDMHLQMTVDPALCKEVEHTILQKKERAEHVVAEVMEKFRLRFEKIPDVGIRQRFEDVEGVCFRILSFLSTPSMQEIIQPPEIINPYSLKPSDLQDKTFVEDLKQGFRRSKSRLFLIYVFLWFHYHVVKS